jgi:hypothetical protein
MPLDVIETTMRSLNRCASRTKHFAASSRLQEFSGLERFLRTPPLVLNLLMSHETGRVILGLTTTLVFWLANMRPNPA